MTRVEGAETGRLAALLSLVTWDRLLASGNRAVTAISQATVTGQRSRRSVLANRSAETGRRWPTAYPDRWQSLLHAAERRLVCEAGAESVLILRQLLRSADEKIRRDAARLLVNLRLELAKLDFKAAAKSPAGHTSDAARLLAHLLETHSDEHLAQLVAAEVGRAAG